MGKIALSLEEELPHLPSYSQEMGLDLTKPSHKKVLTVWQIRIKSVITTAFQKESRRLDLLPMLFTLDNFLYF